MPSLKTILRILIAFWLLVAINTSFYENTAGRVLDIFLTRDPYDLETPGSGFTDWHVTFSRRHHTTIALAWGLLRLAIFFSLAVFSLLLVIAFENWRAKQGPDIEVVYEYLERTGEAPPWLRKHEHKPEPKPKRDTQYMHLSDDVIFVCGVGGGFERVVAGDYEGAISRRRGLSKEFA
jgi:hypothetical protein